MKKFLLILLCLSASSLFAYIFTWLYYYVDYMYQVPTFVSGLILVIFPLIIAVAITDVYD